MQEFSDGSFGEIMPADDLVQEMFQRTAEEFANTKAIHFGTEEELEEVKKQKSAEWRLKKLEEEVESLKPVKSSMILIPTDAQIKRYSNKVLRN